MNYGLPEISYILWGKEASYPSATTGTEPSTTCSNFFWDTQSFSDSNKNALQKLYSIAGGRDIQSVVNGRFDSTITIDAYLTKDQTPWELIMGSISGSGPYTASPTNSLPSFAVEVGYKDYGGNLKRVKFHGCKINSAKINVDKSGDPIKVSLDIFAQRFWLSDTFQTPSVPTTAPFVGYEGKVYIPSDTEVNVLQSFNLTIAHNLFNIEDTSSRFKKGIVERKRDYTFDMSYLMNNVSTLYGNFTGNGSNVTSLSSPSSTDMKVVFEKSASEKIEIVFPSNSVYFDNRSAPLDIGSDLSVVKVDGFATSLTSVTITNS